jgi:transcriptional regulator with XRE-family HTH domain
MASARVAKGLSSIAANIRRLRRERGWTQEQLAEGADLETRYVQTLESRRANPSAATLISVAAALGVGPGTLFRPAAPAERRVGRPRRRAPARPR